MATTFDFVISTPEPRLDAAKQTLNEAHALVAALENELSEFRATSPVARINTSAPGEPVDFPDSALYLLQRSEMLCALTLGAFDCGAKGGPRRGLRFGWDTTAGKAWRLSDTEHLGFGAIGKGFALDRVRMLIEREGFQDYFLSGGGSSLVISGFSAPGEPWTWGWSWKTDETGAPLGFPLSHPTGVPIAIGVSGTQEKGGHLIDPRTGEPALRAQSALVAHRRATDADALSTALFVNGWDCGVPRAESEDETPGLATIDSDGVPRWNGRFASLFGHLQSFFWVAFVSSFAAASAYAEDIDLSELGIEDFTPYQTQRDLVWAALPLAALLLVLLHLKKNKRKRKIKTP